MAIMNLTFIDDENELQNFDCGNASINDRIANSYYRHLCRQAYTYKVCMQDHLVGIYRISINGIIFRNPDEPIAQYYDKEPSFGALVLDYIAVDKQAQNKGVGSIILKYIIHRAKEIYEQIPIRVVMLYALPEKVEWYKKRGFFVTTAQIPDRTSLVPMYLDLMSNEEKAILEPSL